MLVRFSAIILPGMSQVNPVQGTVQGFVAKCPALVHDHKVPSTDAIFVAAIRGHKARLVASIVGAIEGASVGATE